MAESSSVPTAATNLYGSSFGITPTEAKYLRPADTFNEMILNGVSGGYKDIRNMIDKVTGANGKLPQLVRQAVSAIPGEVNISDLRGMLSDQLAQIPGLTDKNVEAHMSAIDKMLKTGDSQAIGHIAPLDMLDSIKQLQSKAAEFYKKPPTDMSRSLGDVYSAGANELRMRLDQAANQANVLAPNATDIASELQNISPRLAQQFAANPTVGTLRSLQAPFVRMSQILDSTMNGAASRSAKIVNGLNRTILGGFGLAAGGVPGIIGSQLAAPVLTAGVDAVLPNVMTKLASGVAKLNPSQAADAISSAAGKSAGGATGLGVVANALGGFDGASAAAPALAQTNPGLNPSQMAQQNQANANQGTNAQQPTNPQAGLPTIPQIEAAMVNDLKTTGGRQMDRLNTLLQAAEYQQNQYGGTVQGGTIATKNAQNVAQQAAQMFLGTGYNPQTGTGGQGGLTNSGLGTGTVAGTLRQLAINLGGKNLDSSAANYQTWANNASYQIAAALNGGYDRVTDTNQKAAENLLPKLTDSPQTAMQKINNIQQYLQAAQASYFGSTPANLQMQSQQQAPQLPDIEQIYQSFGGQP